METILVLLAFVGETIDHLGSPLTKASHAKLCCFLWYLPESTVEQAVEMPVIWDTMALVVTSL